MSSPNWTNPWQDPTAERVMEFEVDPRATRKEPI
jgi:hypothetical protein